MAARRNLVVPLAIVGAVLLFVVAAIYWIEPAKSLPGFVPGHQAGSSHHHFKHGLAAFLLGAGCLVVAWFATGPRRAPATNA
jgi:amino acid transporter